MKYHQWTPLDEIKGPCLLSRYTDDWEDIRLLFFEVELQTVFRLNFGRILASRFTDRRGNIHLQEVGVKNDWSFYQVSDSDFEAWFHEANAELLKAHGVDILHFAICTADECIDILAAEPPVCDWLPDY